ncbi:MAG: hypothetical protein IKX85_07555 [Clostridia bacterium]|nr:hypothetical protein [Clostridia bacterium]
MFSVKPFLEKLITLWYWIVGAMAGCAVLLPAVQFIRLILAYRKELAAYDPDAEKAVAPVFPHFPFKYILIGAILGIVLSIVVIAVIYYVFDNRLKATSELVRPIGTEVFAVYKLSKDSKTLAFAKRLLKEEKPDSPDRQTKLLCAKLQSACRNKEIKRIVFAGSQTGAEKNFILERIALINSVGVPVEWIGDILHDPNAIMKMNAGDGIILVEQVKTATYKTIDTEVAEAFRQKMDLLGFVAVE